MTPIDAERKLRELSFLHEVAQLASSARDWDEMLRIVIDRTTDAMRAEVSSLYLLEKREGLLRLVATNGLNPRAVGRATLRFGEGITGWVANARVPLLVRLREELKKAADDAKVRAVVLRINSPGGAIAPSQEIYEEIRKVRSKSKKPIVASLDSVAASGGFYIASACDQIVSNPGSITGSIGVILQWMEIKDLVSWAKMKPETITSGALKDTGSPYRDLTDAERAYLQRITTQLHAQFIHAVAVGRKGKMSEDEVARVADGRIFTGEEALALKLVDRLGNLDDAVNLAARLAGVRGKPGLIYPRRRQPTLLDLLSNTTDSESLIDRALSRRAGFLYRW